MKFAADGAKVSRISSFLVLSLAVLNDGEEVMSSAGQHTLAIVSSDEKYFTIKECFGEIFSHINQLLSQENGKIVYETVKKKVSFRDIFGGRHEVSTYSFGIELRMFVLQNREKISMRYVKA